MSALDLTLDDLDPLRRVYVQVGLHEELGGIEALDEGLLALAAGAGPLVGELAMATERGVPISDAVHDPDRYPHLTRAHGFVKDLMTVSVPAELLPWMYRFFGSISPDDVAGIGRDLLVNVLRARDPSKAALYKFAIFECLCIAQWMSLRLGKTRLELLDADPRTVEALAEREVEMLDLNYKPYEADLLDIDNPMEALEKIVTLYLGDHIDILKDAMKLISAETAERLEARRKLLELMEDLAPDDAVIFKNECEEGFGGTPVGAQQLRTLHPVALGHLGRDGVYKRRRRLFETVGSRPGAPGRITMTKVGRCKTPTLADIALSVLGGEDDDA